MLMPAVMKNFFMAVYPLNLVFAYTRDKENASHVFLIYYFQKEYLINHEYKMNTKNMFFIIFFTRIPIINGKFNSKGIIQLQRRFSD